MRMSDPMNFDFLHATGGTTSQHFMVQIRLCESKYSFIFSNIF